MSRDVISTSARISSGRDTPPPVLPEPLLVLKATFDLLLPLNDHLALLLTRVVIHPILVKDSLHHLPATSQGILYDSLALSLALLTNLHTVLIRFP